MPPSSPAILILGADGQLGRAVASRFGREAAVHPLSRQDLDITDAAAVAAAFDRIRPAVALNCAAFNDVDGAEVRQEHALRVNGVAVGILARAADRAGAALVHFSTDFVFAGREPREWTETDAPEPQSVYAQSKLMGEWLARDAARHYVLRVESLFGGSRRRSTIDRIVDALRAGEAIKLFQDRTVSPSYVDDVAEASWRLVEIGAPRGVYHAVNSGATTWDGLGRAVARTLQLDERLIVPTAVATASLKASRPQYAALANGKLTGAGVPMPRWEDALARYLSRLPA